MSDRVEMIERRSWDAECALSDLVVHAHDKVGKILVSGHAHESLVRMRGMIDLLLALEQERKAA
jgi:hypothetical protein